MRVAFGPEQHMKQVCDGMMSHMNQVEKHAAMEKLLSTCDDLVQAYSDASASLAALDKDRPPEHDLNFTPPPKDKIVSDSVKLSSRCVPIGIKSSHDWHFQLNDSRRKSVWGRHKQREATAIHARANVLSNLHAPADQIFLPIVLPSQEEDAVDISDAEEEAILTTQTREYNGWKYSYRRDQPELRKTADFRRRLQMKLTAVAKVCPLVEAQRRRFHVHKFAAAQAAVRKSNLAKQRQAKALRILRKK